MPEQAQLKCNLITEKPLCLSDSFLYELKTDVEYRDSFKQSSCLCNSEEGTLWIFKFQRTWDLETV